MNQLCIECEVGQVVLQMNVLRCCLFCFQTVKQNENVWMARGLCECEPPLQLQHKKCVQQNKTKSKKKFPNSLTELYFRNKNAPTVPWTSHLDPAFLKAAANRIHREGNVYGGDSLSLPQAQWLIPGQVTIYTARANHVKDLSFRGLGRNYKSCPTSQEGAGEESEPWESTSAVCHPTAWRSQTAWHPLTCSQRRRGWSESACCCCAVCEIHGWTIKLIQLSPLSFHRRKNWRNRIRLLLKTNSSKSVLHLMKNRSYR